jgi:2-keto-4-pentenoate hydratase/2-oxohepta-3-ene-1,7-dioic acid hydratase in catechol pathway
MALVLKGKRVRLASIRTQEGLRLHVKGVRGYVDVARSSGVEAFGTLQGLLDGGPEALASIEGLKELEGPEFAPADFGPATPDAPRVLCLGVNYSEHAREGGREVPSWPETFIKSRDTVLGPYDSLVKPVLSDCLDYEAELGVVIGAGGRYIKAEDAYDAICGFVVLNDVSAREWQRAMTQWTAGKNFDASMPIGPEVVTKDEVDVEDALVQSVLNGTVMQSARTSAMIVNIASAIEFFSSFTTLRPGDVIATGTPGGVGFARKPPVWLVPGDVIEVTIEGVGSLRNTVVAEEGAPENWRWKPVKAKTDTL